MQINKTCIVGLNGSLFYLLALLMEWLPDKLITHDKMQVDSVYSCAGDNKLVTVSRAGRGGTTLIGAPATV